MRMVLRPRARSCGLTSMRAFVTHIRSLLHREAVAGAYRLGRL